MEDISPEEAYTDPVTEEIPDVLFDNQGRGCSAFGKGMNLAALIQQSEDEKYLDKLL